MIEAHLHKLTVVGFAGAAGVGKTHLAWVLDKTLQQKKVPVYIRSFADPIRDIARALFDSSFSTQEEKEQHLPGGTRFTHLAFEKRGDGPHLGDKPVTGRRLLQFIGTEFGRDMIDPDIWVDAFLRFCKHLHSNIDHHSVLIVPDVRMENEAAAVRKYGLLVHVDREGYDARFDDHPTEHGLKRSAREDLSVVVGSKVLDRSALSAIMRTLQGDHHVGGR